MFYYVYILYSLRFYKLYIGFTKNLVQRVKKHNSGQSQATKPYFPYELIHYEAFLNKNDALNREIYLKSGYGLRSIKKMLKHFLNEK